MNKSELFTELYKRYGAVTRARGPFFYTKKGVRVTDLYQEAGRAILGWEGGSAFTMFKNVLSRGQTGSFICEDCPEPRLQKAVSELLASDRTIFCFSSHKDAFDAGLSLFPDETSVYRPWNSINGKINICYYGALAKWFDYDLIKKIAKTQKYNIILFGIKYDESFDKNINGEFAGHVRHLVVPQRNAVFDDIAGPSRVRPESLPPCLAASRIDDVDCFGGAVLVIVIA